MTPFKSRSMNVPLTGKQKGELSRLAKLAWQRFKGLGLTDETESDFRGREAVECEGVGCRVSEAKNGHFEKLESHFKNLAGNSAGALDAELRSQTAEVRQARHKLDQLLAEKGHVTGYAEVICQSTYKCSLSKATAEQLLNLRNTIYNRPARRHE